MFRLLGCVTEEHNLRLIGLAAAVCVFTSLIAITLFRHSSQQHDRNRSEWLLAAGFVAASGTWATHFIAMLAYRPGVEISFDLALTIASYVCAVALIVCGLFVASAGRRLHCDILGGLLVASGIASMHYMGMVAVVVPGRIEWDAGYVCASLIAVGVLAPAAIVAAQRASGPLSTAAAAGVLSLAIVALHFTAMTAVQFTPDPALTRNGVAVEPDSIAAMIATVMAAVLLVAVVGVIAAQKLAEQTDEFGREVKYKSFQLDLALNNMAQGLSMFDADSRLVMCNGRYRELYDLPAQLAQPGTPLIDILQSKIARGVVTDWRSVERIRDMFTQPPVSRDERFIYSDVRGRRIAVLRRPVESGGWVATHEDITEQQRAEERISFLAMHDYLTGLPNRPALNEKLAERERAFAESGTRFAIVAIDVDNFKMVNDVFGHTAGDALLAELALRFGKVSADACVFRPGGDEFIVLAEIVDRQPLLEFAEELRVIASLDMTFDGRLIKTGLSVGVAIFPDDGETIERVLNNADAALYRAKREGGAKICAYAEDIDKQRRESLALLVDLRKAISRREFQLVYQPLFEMDGRPIGFEALLRWRHPERGIVSPATFIPVAEANGLILQIDEWVAVEACKEAARWRKPLKVAVNISALHFQSGSLSDTIGNALEESGLRPDRLVIELTEGCLVADAVRASAVILRLKALGVELAMDDFGTGYSSLSYLHAFPFDKIKLDRSFVMNLGTREKSRTIARAIISLSHSLGLKTIAEGVETEIEAEFLRRHGCDFVQGYLFGRPLPIEEYQTLTGVEGRDADEPMPLARAG